MLRLKVGDEVRWVSGASFPAHKNAIGTIIAITPDDADTNESSMYDITFSFGKMALYGTQIEAARYARQSG
jgi:hypothetical protein